MDEVTVRPATPDDAGAINDIFNYYVLNSTCIWQVEPDSLETRAAWLASHGDPYPVLVAEIAGRVVGWASLSPSSSRYGWRYTVEDSIFLHPDARGRGIGKILLVRLIDEARARGYRVILASISADQPASVVLHERLGFEKVGYIRGVGYKKGRTLDMIYMQLTLGPQPDDGTGEDK